MPPFFFLFEMAHCMPFALRCKIVKRHAWGNNGAAHRFERRSRSTTLSWSDLARALPTLMNAISTSLSRLLRNPCCPSCLILDRS